MTSVISTYEELLADMQSDEYKAAQSVIIDTGGSLVQMMQPWAKTQDSKAARDGRAMYGVIKREFDRLLHQIRTIDKKHCIIIFHTTEVQKGDIVTTRLSCEGGSKDIVWTPADLGGHMHMMGNRRMIGFTPTDEYFAKGCFGVNGLLEIPTLKEGMPNNFLTNLFAQAQAAILTEMASYEERSRAIYDKAIADAKKILDGAKDAKGMNAAVEQLSKLENALTSREENLAKAKEKAASLGLKYSKEAGGYVQADVQPN